MANVRGLLVLMFVCLLLCQVSLKYYSTSFEICHYVHLFLVYVYQYLFSRFTSLLGNICYFGEYLVKHLLGKICYIRECLVKHLLGKICYVKESLVKHLLVTMCNISECLVKNVLRKMFYIRKCLVKHLLRKIRCIIKCLVKYLLGNIFYITLLTRCTASVYYIALHCHCLDDVTERGMQV